MKSLSRRDFLKLASVSALGAVLPKEAARAIRQPKAASNIIILLFDAMSARNLSLYGYERSTAPHLEKFAEKAIVFHEHYSAGNFTTSGTAAMLTGMYPWKNRALNPGGLIKRELIPSNPYTGLGQDYFRFAFSQNPWPDRLLGQFYHDIDSILPPTSYSLRGDTGLADKLGRDRALASVAMEEFLFSAQADVMGSSLLGYLYKSMNYRGAVYEQKAHEQYPRGIPEVEGFVSPYLNEDIFRGVLNEIVQLDQQKRPYFAYFHLYSPHAPYKPREDFLRLFRDKFRPVSKPPHPMATSISERDLLSKRRAYDQQIAQVDSEFGNLLATLDARAILEDTYVVVTSDHGEMFERGFLGHGGQMLYEPNIKIPLLISGPGLATRVDVHQPTSNVDILPTILWLAGREIPGDVDGRVLPELGGEADANRPVFAMTAHENSAFAPLEKAVFSMRKGNHKLIAYFGYEGFDNVFELYDLEQDSEELIDLSGRDSSTLGRMRDEFMQHLAEANHPYLRA